MASARTPAEAVLGRKPPDAELEGALEITGTAVARDDEAGHRRGESAKGFGHGDAVGAGHLQVEDGHVDLVHPSHGDGLRPGSGLRDDLEVVLQPEQRGEGVTEQVFVVGQQQSDHGPPPACRLSGHGTRSRIATGKSSKAPQYRMQAPDLRFHIVDTTARLSYRGTSVASAGTEATSANPEP